VVLVSTAHVLLGLLAGGPRHGYEIKRVHDERLPQAKPLAYGQVYATLGRLERDGLIEQAGQDQGAARSGPRTGSQVWAGRSSTSGWRVLSRARRTWRARCSTR
jgi:Transcriptional regulator PadR-like family